MISHIFWHDLREILMSEIPLGWNERVLYVMWAMCHSGMLWSLLHVLFGCPNEQEPYIKWWHVELDLCIGVPPYLLMVWQTVWICIPSAGCFSLDACLQIFDIACLRCFIFRWSVFFSLHYPLSSKYVLTRRDGRWSKSFHGPQTDRDVLQKGVLLVYLRATLVWLS